MKTNTVICKGVTEIYAERLSAISSMNGIPETDLAGIYLEMGIRKAWEGYRVNKKHAGEIEAFEKLHPELHEAIGTPKGDNDGKE